jgi:hypothetical protein
MPVAVESFVRASEVTDGIDGDFDRRQVVYWCRLDAPVPEGEPNSDEGDALVRTHAAANSADLWDGMPRTGISMEQTLPDLWKVTVTYSSPNSTSQSLSVDPGVFASRYNFDISAETVKTYVALSQQKFGANAPDHDNFINVETINGAQKVQGVDVFYPRQEIEFETNMPLTYLDAARQRLIEAYTGKINSEIFLGSAVGEVLFMGARGSVSTTGDSDITFKFSIRRNPVLPLTLAGITIPILDPDPPNDPYIIYGWDYIWPQWQEQKDPAINDIKTGALGIYVARVFEQEDLNDLIAAPPP